MSEPNQPDNGRFRTDAEGNIIVTTKEYPVAYVEQLKHNIEWDRKKYELLETELDNLREVCWCVLNSITDEDDRKYLKDELKQDDDQ